MLDFVLIDHIIAQSIFESMYIESTTPYGYAILQGVRYARDDDTTWLRVER